jgi:hypothetical protein
VEDCCELKQQALCILHASVSVGGAVTACCGVCSELGCGTISELWKGLLQWHVTPQSATWFPLSATKQRGPVTCHQPSAGRAGDTSAPVSTLATNTVRVKPCKATEYGDPPPVCIAPRGPWLHASERPCAALTDAAAGQHQARPVADWCRHSTGLRTGRVAVKAITACLGTWCYTYGR